MHLIQTELVLLTLVLCSCATTPPKVDIPKPQDAEVSIPEKKEITSFAILNTQIGEAVKSLGNGTKLGNAPALPPDFSDGIVLTTSNEYYFKGSVEVSQFEIIYTGIDGDATKTDYKQGEILGKSKGTSVKICIRSKVVDPYLVACSNKVPIHTEGYWYFFPGMYSPSEMKWLSYKPAEYESFKSMYDHATTEEESYGLTMFNWWSLIETSLNSYPTPVMKDTVEVYDQLILYRDLPLRLTYQKGFLEYLKNEYKIGEKIYLYLQITGVNGFSKEFNCYVRDFSLEPPEAIVQKRIDHILSK